MSETAYDLGKAALLAEGIPEETIPVLLPDESVDTSAFGIL
jgi:hypothetical protein